MANTRKLLVASASTLCLLAAAPADAFELQYAQGFLNFNTGRVLDKGFIHSPAFTSAQTVHSLTVVDNSGILLSAMGNAAAADIARRHAEEAAIERGLRIGETFSYSWNEVPVREGAISYLRFVWGGGGSGTYSTDGTTVTGSALPTNVFGFEFGAPLTVIETPVIPLGLSLAATYYNYGISGLTASAGSGGSWKSSIDRTAVRLPLSLSTAFQVLPALFVHPSVSYDLVSGFGALLGAQGHTVIYQVAAEYSLINILPIQASYRVTSGSTLSESTVDDSMFTLGAAFRF